MYPETITATDTYSEKMLKSVEGFGFGHLFADEIFRGMGVVNTNPWYASSVNESFLTVTREKNSGHTHVYNIYGGTKTEVGYFTESGTDAQITELSNGVALILANKAIHLCDPSSSVSPAPSCPVVMLPEAFDHAGYVKPTQMVQLNFRVIINDEDHDYIYWSGINRPRSSSDQHAFDQYLTVYAYTKTDGTQVTFSDNVYYPPSEGTYIPGTLSTNEVNTAVLNSMKMDFKADSVVALRATDSSLFVFGNSSLQVLRWQNSTDAPFAIVAKSSLAGVAFKDSVTVIGNECYFVGKGPNGMLGVFAVDENCQIRKISTNAVDQRLAKYSVGGNAGFKDIRSFCYSYKGHQFFVFKVEEWNSRMEETLAYDIGEAVWADRASYDENGEKHAWCAIDAQTIEGIPFFVTYTKGGLVRMCSFAPSSNTDHYLDDTNVEADTKGYIVKERTTGIKYDGINDIVVTSLELVMNSGDTTELDNAKDGYNPRVMLQVSTDGGRTWSNELWAYAGRVGQYAWRVRWNGLGRGARFAFRVRMTDPVQFQIATAYLSYLQCGNRI